MKRKSPRGIPDFSKKPKGFNPKGSSSNPAAVQKLAPPVAPKVVNVKPASTSAKSGMRGV
jgi:hypothetical protein